MQPGDRELLNPLFEVLRDRRALLHSGHGRRGQAPYVTESIKAIREQLTLTAQQLHPDSEARSWVEKLRAACREYLTAVESETLVLTRPNLNPRSRSSARPSSKSRTTRRSTTAFQRHVNSRPRWRPTVPYPPVRSVCAVARPQTFQGCQNRWCSRPVTCCGQSLGQVTGTAKWLPRVTHKGRDRRRFLCGDLSTPTVSKMDREDPRACVTPNQGRVQLSIAHVEGRLSSACSTLAKNRKRIRNGDGSQRAGFTRFPSLSAAMSS